MCLRYKCTSDFVRLGFKITSGMSTNYIHVCKNIRMFLVYLNTCECKNKSVCTCIFNYSAKVLVELLFKSISF